MRLPPALVPLRNSTFRMLWLANVVAWLGTWLQNTGAGWLMTSLAPEPLIVAMVQAATIMPVFLLALPGGALADIVDRRVFLIGTQFWTILAAITLAALTIGHGMTAFVLLALTFAIGIGSALTAPAWSAIVPELVPREDLVQAIALNGIGYNLTRAVGPAIAGFTPFRSWPCWSRCSPGTAAAGSPACRASTCCRRCGRGCVSCATRRRSSSRWCGRSRFRCLLPRRGHCCRCWCASAWALGRACTASSWA
jgi:MFS family permease